LSSPQANKPAFAADKPARLANVGFLRDFSVREVETDALTRSVLECGRPLPLSTTAIIPQNQRPQSQATDHNLPKRQRTSALQKLCPVLHDLGGSAA
jgi:hypothetical protein